MTAGVPNYVTSEQLESVIERFERRLDKAVSSIHDDMKSQRWPAGAWVGVALGIAGLILTAIAIFLTFMGMGAALVLQAISGSAAPLQRDIAHNAAAIIRLDTNLQREMRDLDGVSTTRDERQQAEIMAIQEWMTSASRDRFTKDDGSAITVRVRELEQETAWLRGHIGLNGGSEGP